MSQIDNLREQVDSWAEELTENYLVSLSSTFPTRPKIINDGVWGITTVTAVEQAVLNSPLLQRLRGIRQLGVVHFVYPTAEYSRFVHSVGVLNRVNACLEALQVRVDSNKKTAIEDWKPVARLAALTHDIGHTFLSHVTESHGRETLPIVDSSIADLCREFNNEFDTDGRVDLGEILSFAIINSSSFRRILEFAGQRNLQIAPEGIDHGRCVEIISGAVVRSRSLLEDSNCMWIADLVNGPLDADKQDYIRRDALSAGIEVPFEPERMTTSLTLIDIPEWFDREKGRNRPARTVVGLTLTGCTSADELILSRMLLQIKLYYHQKSRVYEQMAASAWRIVMDNFDLLMDREFDVSDIFSTSSELLFDGRLKNKVDNELSNDGNNLDLKKLALYLKWLMHRPTPRRVYVYGRSFPSIDVVAENRRERTTFKASNDELETRSNEIWQRLSRAVKKDPEAVKSEIVSIANLMVHALGKVVDNTEALLEAGVIVDYPPSKKIQIQSGMYVDSQDSEVPNHLTYSDVFRVDQWTDAFRDSRQLCSVYAPEGFEEIVYLASELVFYRDYEVLSRTMGLEYAKCDLGLVHEYKQQLVAAGIYENEVGNYSAILQHPYWMSDQDRAAYEEHIKSIRRNFENIELKKPKALECFNTTCSFNVIFVDLIDSTRFFEQLSRDEHESLLGTLAEFLSLTETMIELPIKPLKGEGDAIFLVAEEKEIERVLTNLVVMIVNNEWESFAADKLADIVSRVGQVPAIRFSVSESIEGNIESFDVSGREVTRLFRLEYVGKLEDGERSVTLVGEMVSYKELIVDNENCSLIEEGEKTGLKGINVPVKFCVIGLSAIE